ncbi:MAG: hypothetical protein HKN40_11155 [Winogradskyella sp.]|uniref:hypothetical protein n=1 Tax=Winogradskyella sp. TaxID=1883156 RepID=UPI0018553824|nr:hypothetical protein [Winogradskyella sp.]
MLRIINLIKKGEFKFIVKGVSKRVFSETKTFGLKRDLRMHFNAIDPKINIRIRLYRDEDKAYFIKDLQNHGLIEKNIPKCYVATTDKNLPCFRQWLIISEYRDAVQDFWGPIFPILKEDEILLEGGFTIPTMRNKGIMSTAIPEILEIEKPVDKRYVITFVGVNNIPSLKGIHRSGFVPYILRIEKWCLFNRRVIFKEIPENEINLYRKNLGITSA